MLEHLLRIAVLFLQAGLAVVFAYPIYICVYNRFFHPLAKFPGPFWWGATYVPWSYNQYKGYLPLVIHELHKKYGDVVRISPGEVSFLGGQAWKDVYGPRKTGDRGYPFPKEPGQSPPAPNGHYPISNMPDVAEHVKQRRQIAHAFSDRALSEQEPMIQGYVGQLIKRISEHATSGREPDMAKYFNFTTFDITGDLAFGDPFNCLEEDRYHWWIQTLIQLVICAFKGMALSCYGFLDNYLKMLLIPKSLMQTYMDLWNLAALKVDKRLEKGQDARKDIYSFIMENRESYQMSKGDLEATGWILILAGADTTSTTLTAALCYLAHHRPVKFRKLASELREAFESAAEITFKATAQLPYLNAIINETMRIAPPVGGNFTRVVDVDNSIVSGHYLPRGAYVGVPVYATHHASSKWAHSEDFIPERWLQPSSPLFSCDEGDPQFDEKTFANDSKQDLNPFSTGPRSCVGQPLAWAEMRLVLSHLVWHFDFSRPSKDGDLLVWNTQKIWNNWDKAPMRCRVAVRPDIVE